MESIGFLKHSFRVLIFNRSLRFSSSMQTRRYLSSTQNTSENSQTQNDQNETSENPQSQKVLNEMQAQLKVLEEKNTELLDKYRRSLAEGENIRQRLNKQITDAKTFGIQSFCKDLLEVADILSHATNSVPKEHINDQNPHLKNLYDGLLLTRNSLEQVFKRHGLEPIKALNTKFDPNIHEALFQKECADVEPGTVVEETKVGYKLHNRCIRPALVGVSRK